MPVRNAASVVGVHHDVAVHSGTKLAQIQRFVFAAAQQETVVQLLRRCTPADVVSVTVINRFPRDSGIHRAGSFGPYFRCLSRGAPTGVSEYA